MDPTKVCRLCGTIKALEAYPKRKDSPDGYRNDCRDCNIVKQKAYYSDTKDARAEKRRTYYLERREEIVDDRRRFRVRERERITAGRRASRAKDPERFQAERRRSYWRNWEKEQERAKRLRFRRRWIRIEDLVARDGPICGICKDPLIPNEAEIDHIYPRALGGSHELSNLQLAHKFCNRTKGKRILEHLEAVSSPVP